MRRPARGNRGGYRWNDEEDDLIGFLEESACRREQKL
jgi:hypothetical protein